MRGYAADASVILPRIAKDIRQHAFVLIVIDPLYKILGDREDASKDMADLMLAIERLAVHSNAAVFFGAHFSKGNQSLKEAMDGISGSHGVLARDPDTIITMTDHEEDEAYTVDMILRNFPTQERFTIQGANHPLMVRADQLDPSRLKKPKKPNQSVYSSTDLLRSAQRKRRAQLGLQRVARGVRRENRDQQNDVLQEFQRASSAGKIFNSEVDEKWSFRL